MVDHSSQGSLVEMHGCCPQDVVYEQLPRHLIRKVVSEEVHDPRVRDDPTLPAPSPQPQREFGVLPPPQQKSFVESITLFERVTTYSEKATANERNGRGSLRFLRQPLRSEVRPTPTEPVPVHRVTGRASDRGCHRGHSGLVELLAERLEPALVRLHVRITEDEHRSVRDAGAQVARPRDTEPLFRAYELNVRPSRGERACAAIWTTRRRLLRIPHLHVL